MSRHTSTETVPPNAANPPAPPVSKGRLWLGVVAAPLAWALTELVGYVIVSRSCERGRDGLHSMAAVRPGVVLTSLAIVMAIVSLGALLLSVASWRTLDSARAPDDHSARIASSAETPEDAPAAPLSEWTRARFMAFAGIMVSALCGFGILFWSVPPFLLDVCNQVR